MLSPALPDRGAMTAAAAQLADAGLDLVPAGVAAAVLVSLVAALLLTALHRRETEREHTSARPGRRGRRPGPREGRHLD
jgi:hypothetical protein